MRVAGEPGSQQTSRLRATYAEVITARREQLRSSVATVLAPGQNFIWEVGCGHGHFLTAYATAHPNQYCIGVDIANERIERALRKRDRARLNNLHFFRADAFLFLQALPPRSLICGLYVLFPDPWPKLRHHKHRLLQPPFLAATAAVTTPACSLFFRTDFRPYFEQAQATISSSPHWEVLTAEGNWPFESATVFQSRAPSHDSLIARRRGAIAS